MKKLLPLLSLMLCCSASAQQAEKDPFIGLKKAAVVEQFGKPTTVTRDEKGEVLVYLRERTAISAGAEPSSAGNLSAVPMVAMQMPDGAVSAVKKTEAYTFFLNKKGEVYSWKIDNR